MIKIFRVVSITLATLTIIMGCILAYATGVLIYTYFKDYPGTPLGGDYATDGKAVFYCGVLCPFERTRMVEADLATFEVIQTYYAKDKNHVYYYADIIEGADPATFKEAVGYDCDDCSIRIYMDDKNFYDDGKVIDPSKVTKVP